MKTRVNDPGRNRKALFSTSPVTARIVAWMSRAETPRSCATQMGTRAGTCAGSLDDQGSISGWTNCVANVKTDSNKAADSRVMTPAVASPRRAAARSGPLTNTAAAAILMTLGGVKRTSRPSAFDSAKGQ